MKQLLLVSLLALALAVVHGQAVGQYIWTKDAGNPVLSGGVAGTWNRHLFVPAVLYNADSSRYEMWFGASSGPNPYWAPYRVGFAVSKDGIDWTMHPSPVVSPDSGTWDAYTIERPFVIRENGLYKMWYSGNATGSPPIYVGYATSSDGIHWTKYPGNPVLGPGSSAWEAGGPGCICIVPFPGGYRLWYAAINANGTASNIGYAVSIDGVTWERDTLNNPILRAGSSGQWDYPFVSQPRLFHHGDTYYMYYIGYSSDGSLVHVGAAVSNDTGRTWSKHAQNPVLSDSPYQWDGSFVQLGSVLLRGDTLHMWYSGSRINTTWYLWRIGHATSQLVTGIVDGDAKVPRRFSLSQNYPNPFNPTTTIRYALSSRSDVRLTVVNSLGQLVATLVQGEQEAGWYESVFDATGLASGVYLYRLQAGDLVQTRKLILIH